MSEKILLIDSNPQVIELIRYPLQDEGYDVLTARDGKWGLRKAVTENPNLLILSLDLPGQISGQQLCHHLRQDPATHHLPIILVVNEDQLEDLEIGSESGADDYLIKPFGAVQVITKVKPLLLSGQDQERTAISTGNGELDNKMGGGIPLGSLTLVEGDSGAGKSVLTQQMLHGSLEDGYKLSLFTSENTVKSLVKQMRSLNLEIIDYLLLDRVRIFSIETSHLGSEGLTRVMQALKQEKGRDMLLVDSLTSTIPQSSDREVVAFFEESKRLCSDDTTVILVVHSYGLTRELLTRIRSLCDAHLQLRTEEVGNKLVKTLEVTKVRGAEQNTGNIISFEVEPGWGMRVIPISKVKG